MLKTIAASLITTVTREIIIRVQALNDDRPRKLTWLCVSTSRLYYVRSESKSPHTRHVSYDAAANTKAPAGHDRELDAFMYALHPPQTVTTVLVQLHTPNKQRTCTSKRQSTERLKHKQI